MIKKMEIFVWLFVLAFIVLMSACGVQDQKSEKQPVVKEKVTPEWAKDAVIYEVNTRQYTPEGTFNAFKTHLPRLKELGVDILWFMPIHPIGELNRKGSLGSYYSVRDYTAVNPEYGTLDDFKALVQEAHAMGFKVILDWVANHTAFDHAWVTEHPEWYTKDEAGNIVSPFDWSDVADLNYDDNPALWDAMIGDMKFWLTNADIDGFRCDVAGMVPTAFWDKARLELDAVKPVFMLAEDEGQRDLMKNAFDANYAWELHHVMNQIAKGDKTADDLWVYFAKNDTLFDPSVYRMTFTSNHDENSWNGTTFERLGDGAKAFAVLTYMVPGFPLIYNGQEVALNHRLLFFEKDEIDWTQGADFTALYARLGQIKKENPALFNANNGGDFVKIATDQPESIMAFTRTKGENQVIVLINLTPEDHEVKLLDDQFNGTYLDLIGGESVDIKPQQAIKMPAWSYLVLQ